jgi:RHS repeat-associated protein
MTEKKVYVDNVLNETYYYTWAYGKLANQVYIKEGTQQAKHTIKYVYDSFNSVQGFILDHTETFLFLKNLFGDIIGLVDNAGNIVVSYEYTPWGVPTITCDNIEISSEDILKMLPLSYRGCCYDYYSGLYYVEGRYYNPKVGNFINSSGTENSGLSEIPSNYSLFSYWENHPLWYVDSDIRETLNANSIANYLHNKQVTNNLTGYFESNNGFIFNQRADEMHQYRFGFNHVGNVGCGLVATYNTLLLLENQTESHNIISMYFHDVIRECEQIGLLAYNMGVHPFATVQFFIKKNYDVNISFNNFDNVANNENIVNIMHYTHCGGTHYVAIKYENQKFKGYNAFCNKNSFDEFDSIATLENGNNTYQGKILISISEKQ